MALSQLNGIRRRARQTVCVAVSPSMSVLASAIVALSIISPGLAMRVHAAAVTTVRIANPLSNVTYFGVITVAAVTTNADRVTYKVDGGVEQALVLNTATALWESHIDTRLLTNGTHTVDVVNHGLDSSVATDRAWNVEIRNSAPTPTPSPAITIENPTSNTPYAGTIEVRASGQSLVSAAYQIDGSTPVPMAYRSTDDRWTATLNTGTWPARTHAVDVIGTGANGASVSDRAWSVPFSPTAVTIASPLSDQVYAGTVIVAAIAPNAQTAAFKVDGGSEQPLTFDPVSGRWQASVDSLRLANGAHNIDVVNHGRDNLVVTDRAWNIQVRNTLATPVPTTTASSPLTSTSFVTTSGTMLGGQPAAGQPGRSLLGLIGDDTHGTVLAAETAAGVNTKIIRLSWKDYVPSEGQANSTYVSAKRSEIETLRAAGIGVILDLGLQDTPAWLHQNYSNSYYVNQFGDRYGDPTQPDQGDANLVFNPAVRATAAEYLGRIFADLGTDFRAIRLGGGRWGELTYPPATYNGHSNVYWGFDANAVRSAPTHNWQPGQPQVYGEASAFINWYLNALVDYQNWQISTIRRAYSGSLMVLYPSWGIRPGQLDEAINDGLNGTSSAEINGEVERGFDFARQIAAVTDARVIVTTTWLDADASRDSSADSRAWSPVKYLASLASAHPLKLTMYGENTGHGNTAAMMLAAQQAKTFGLIGMAWFNETELSSGSGATLNDFANLIGSVL